MDGALAAIDRLTPTESGIELRRADFATLTDALDYAAQGATGFNYYDGRGELSAALSYRELREQARELALRLQRFGRGSRVALVAHTHPDFAVMFYACQYAAVVPVPLPAAIHLGGRDAYVRHLHEMLRDCQASAAFAPADFVDMLREASQGLPMKLAGTRSEFMALEAAPALPKAPKPDELAYLQYTSGSTRFPRGTMIKQSAVLNNLEAIFNHGFRMEAGDRFCSWLPYYHDMGLVGIVLGCVATQRSVDYLATREFAMRPRLWLKLMSQNRATISFSPPFGYALCARRLRQKDAEALDLSSWRVAGVGAEMIHPEWLQTFADVLAPAGFDAKAFLPSYGMAECALGVSFAPIGTGSQIDHVDGEYLSMHGEARAVGANVSRSSGYINCGEPLPGFEVEIRDERGGLLPDRHCGRIFLRGPSVMSGYFGNVDATREALSIDGWLNTGDLGYRVNGNLHITGRAKDLLIINGRNIWPQDIELLAEQQPEVRPTDTSAFSIAGEDGGEVAVLVVQCRETDAAALASLVQRLQQAIYGEFGIHCLIELVPPHTLPRTSSGKLSRSTARKEFLERHSGERWKDAPRALISDGARARMRKGETADFAP
ncbi:fatty-acyl-CoA synthase [Panacagrimonas perspica]|uniref:Fatty-acyl-CoA synthase n=1 Tax=Panacagrimonas perspica TaxID=381431 RepID=A0A4R7P548_9GAMM|nr:fatty-acyl-CoA synthase [Panacagrimonas perspica]